MMKLCPSIETFPIYKRMKNEEIDVIILNVVARGHL